MIIPLSILQDGTYERPTLSLPPDAPADAVLLTGGWRKGDVDLTCGSCGRLLATRMGKAGMKRVHRFIFICPTCGRGNALDT